MYRIRGERDDRAKERHGRSALECVIQNGAEPGRGPVVEK